MNDASANTATYGQTNWRRVVPILDPGPLRMYVWTQDALRDGPITAVAVAESLDRARVLLAKQGVPYHYLSREPQSFPVDMPVAWIYGNRQ